MNLSPIFKEVILIGGGHTHALFIKQWGMKPLPGVRVTLISPQAQTPYSGMLPGFIAGHYSFDQIHIDLPKLCQWANVRFIQDKVIDIDANNNCTELAERSSVNNKLAARLSYDVLSIDIGSTPSQAVSGVSEFAAPIKPIAGFYHYWQKTIEVLRNSDASQSISVVGGGAGAVETIMAMAWALENDKSISCEVEFTLVFRGESILLNYPKAVIKKAEKACINLGIKLQRNFEVDVVDKHQLRNRQGGAIHFDHLFWCTQASAASWISNTELDCTESGFVQVNQFLQSLNFTNIFAAGDIAHMNAKPVPKAGVYAVRQAPILFENIGRQLLGKRLKAYHSQDNFLTLLSLGSKTAIGIRKPFPMFSGRWVWSLKDRIDQKFMNAFQDLPFLSMGITPNDKQIRSQLIPVAEQQEEIYADKRCGGCGAKIGRSILSKVLAELTGAYKPEDATVIEWPANSLIQTIDQITAPFDNPYLFGRIAVFHALNDLFAMNAKAHSIQISVTLPFAGRETQTRELRQLLQGVLSACDESSVILLGGHSAEGKEVSLSIAANGIPQERLFSKQGVQKGDLLVLSKPLGTGLILAGNMLQKTKGKDLINALNWMNMSNQAAAIKLDQWQSRCCTDISGFGLLGHLSEMLNSGERQVALRLEALPVLSGAVDLINSGVRSSLFPQNELSLQDDARWNDIRHSQLWPLLIDPQTSGGLLASIAPEYEHIAMAEGFSVIGRVF